MDADLLKSVRSGLDELEQGNVSYKSIRSLATQLTELWDPRPVVREEVLVRPMRGPARLSMPLPDVKRPPPWFLGMSSGFAKQISKIDRKLQGRILEALVAITDNPEQLRGDTMKPLVGDLKGCWRYRLADHRIIYSADKATGDITLLAFAPRGSAYAA